LSLPWKPALAVRRIERILGRYAVRTCSKAFPLRILAYCRPGVEERDAR